MAKITKATLKSFIKKNQGKLYISNKSSFDGMYDYVMPSGDNSFTLSMAAGYPNENNLGIQGVWLVGGSRNSFLEVTVGGFKGINVYNCCGEFTLAVRA